MDKEKTIIVALAGNPNTGKSTIFNKLTGARQHIGNYPGVTVEKKEGVFEHNNYEVRIVDLPGTYDLTSDTLDELVTRKFLIDEKPDIVVDVLDSSNLERNLYLGVQLSELGIPLILDLNMIDVLESRGRKIDVEKLSKLMSCPAITTIGTKGKGIAELKDAIVALADNETVYSTVQVDYGIDSNNVIEAVQKPLSEIPEVSDKYELRWLSVKLLEDDKELKESVSAYAGTDISVFSHIAKLRKHIEITSFWSFCFN
ncbi:MAG: FeoB small GTPase domain-containing protein [Planctomycetota bacterium]